MAVNSAKISLSFFLAGSTIFVTLLLPSCGVSLGPYVYLTLLFYYTGLNVAIAVCMHGFAHQVAIRSAFLGFANSLGIILLCTASSPWNVFGCYMFYLTFFHFSEFLVIALTNPKSACVDSFMLNHSWEYGAAALASWTEFLLEVWLFPRLKRHPYITFFGALLCFGGEVLRKLAIFTAKTNFSHVVQNVQEEGHQLVTHGIYSWFRHPSYVGWFYWSIGTQLILVNPVCVVLYAFLSWKFFYYRVQVEELTLLRFFGSDYYNYQQKVGTGLPFISGYLLNLDRCIDHAGPIVWPVRFLNLNPLDYYLWGHVKTIVYATPVPDRAELH